MKNWQKSTLFWILSLIITLTSAVYQRITGPTYDKTAKVEIVDTTLSCRLIRSASTSANTTITLHIPDQTFKGFIEYKTLNPTDDCKNLKLR